MARDYSYNLDCVAVESLLRLPARERDFLISVFRHLAANPYQNGESFFHDPVGRQIQRKLFGNWMVSFWSDHAVKEVRIVGVQKVRR